MATLREQLDTAPRRTRSCTRHGASITSKGPVLFALMGLVVGGLDRSGDPAALGNLVPVSGSPVPDRRKHLRTLPARTSRDSGHPRTRTNAGRRARRVDERSQSNMQPARVLRAQIDLVRDIIEREGNSPASALGNFTAINVIHQNELLRHADTMPLTPGLPRHPHRPTLPRPTADPAPPVLTPSQCASPTPTPDPSTAPERGPVSFNR